MLEQQVRGIVENSLTVLLVSDLERSQAYYRDVLGCEVTEWWAIRDNFGLGFKLLQAEDASDVRPYKNSWNTYAYVKTAEQLNALYEEFKSKGAQIVQEPQQYDFDWGTWREFSLQDPDGYVIGFGSGAPSSASQD